MLLVDLIYNSHDFVHFVVFEHYFNKLCLIYGLLRTLIRTIKLTSIAGLIHGIVCTIIIMHV